MRQIFCKGKKVLLGYLIIILTVFLAVESLLGNFFATISPLSLPETNLLPSTRFKTQQTVKTTLQQITPELKKLSTVQSQKQGPSTSHISRLRISGTLSSNTSKFKETTWDPSSVHKKAITKNCTPKVDPSNIKTPFKFYIYDLPSKFNYDIQRLFTDDKKHSFCYNLDYCGMGEELYLYSSKGTQLTEKGNHSDGRMSVRNTHQFALEVVIHYKLLHSPYRTNDPKQADMFYIPAYTGLHCLTFQGNSKEFVNELFQHLETKEKTYFKSGRPHFSTLSKIQREQASTNCPTLLHPNTKDITFIAIEKEANPNWSRNKGLYGKSIIVAPYPSYIHFINSEQERSLLEYHSGFRNFNESKFELNVPHPSERNLTLFLAAGTRRSNHFRAQLLDQFSIQTDTGPEEFYKSTSNKSDIQQVMLITNECSLKHRTTTIPWMQRSVFCLQPPGDSPTRKSLYDSILSGCIPVLFTGSYKTEYPFQRHLDYKSFTYTIDEKLISRYKKTVIEILKEISKEKTRSLYDNLVHVSKWFQYSIPNGDVQWEDDALTLILDELAYRNNIKVTQST